ncbi:sugar phosphate isomerase/epimerase [Paenibacillus sp. N1-5-1-14]|uniref:sugar phosphate isomerase/epimerase family protein n=1 Tax=Paenibacillus radicibacter TaxID=2972488 RepID=UPI002159649A|nr:sugar phosphate isomerase/epimerase [Paenibacillus radicibacter]MCR8642473.1 sugar phosphate isomerase/epimerase [Paenibacillus radicibacter]
MKIGLSSYSLYRELNAGTMNIVDCIKWVAEIGGSHIEIVPLGFDLVQDEGLAETIQAEARKAGIAVSNYAISANFVGLDEEQYQQEIERVKSHVDIANRLGAKLMRHDIASRPIPETTLTNYIKDLDRMTDACGQIADYAAQYGITTSIENHGFYVQASDRVRALVDRVNRPNFRTTLDVGNFVCVDENPLVSVSNNLPYASIVHLKDFYIRPAAQDPGDGWFRSAGGQYLRGAVVGQGDLDMRGILKTIKASGYDGYFSVEFEGKEDCLWGSKTGIENALRIWNEV